MLLNVCGNIIIKANCLSTPIGDSNTKTQYRVQVKDALTDLSDWESDAWKWAVDAKITDGTNPRGAITREQVATMLHRFSQMK